MPGGLHAWANFSTPVPVRGQVKARTLLCHVALEASRRKELLRCGGYFDANIHFSYYTFYMYRKGKYYTFRRVLEVCTSLLRMSFFRKVSPLYPSEKSRKNQSFVPIFLFHPADYHYGSVQTEFVLKGEKFDLPFTVLINSMP